MKRVQVLDQEIRSIAQRERGAIAELILKLKEMDSLQGYRELGFDSLYDYLTRGIGYSSGSAQRRIDAARLSKDVPEVIEKFSAGTLDFHHVSTMSKAIRQIKKKRKVSTKEKSELFERLECKTESKTKQMVAEFFDLPVIFETKKSIQKDSSVRIEITISQELADKIEQAQALISHSVPTKDLACFLDYVAEKIIKQKAQKPKERKPSTAMAVRVGEAPSPEIAAVDIAKPVPQRLHRTVRSEGSACARCGSAWFPQTDHVKSRWTGGKNNIQNLQTLCGPCNRAKYQREWDEVRAITI